MMVIELAIKKDKYGSFKDKIVAGAELLNICDYGNFLLAIVRVRTQSAKTKMIEIGFEYARDKQDK